MRPFLYGIFILIFSSTIAQNTDYWQQQADYEMDIDMNLNNYQYKGKQKLVYTNNSPDELKKVYYHLYFNAFQPGSEMDIHLQDIRDPDARMVHSLGTADAPIFKSRISELKPSEMGFIKVLSLSQNKKPLTYHIEGTVLEVALNKGIKPGSQAVFDMEFLGQVPLQIRRSGRNNKEGVALSMSQWYPKIAAYDFQGWHANAYIAREFYGVWGNVDLKIHIDKNYVLGASGYLQNPEKVGHGYQNDHKKVALPRTDKLTWHFIAPKVHDFTWAADPDFEHDVLETKLGTKLHFLYKRTMDDKYLNNWKKLQPKTAELLDYYNEHLGAYPYKQYSVIQGGDGGMEYAMSTLITGEREFGSLFGVVAHEMAHSWFQFVLASNEAKYAWMDEGFTTYISNYAVDKILEQKKENPQKEAYTSYVRFLDYQIEEPLSTPADLFEYNYAYGIGSYNKGALFLAQLEYIIGKENVENTLKLFYENFKFKHPTPNDIKRTAERVSGISLDWYLYYWTQTTHTIDYAVKAQNSNEVVLERIGKIPMPVEVFVRYTDNTTEYFYVPLTMMRGEKPSKFLRLKDWSWVAKRYRFKTEKPIQYLEIDPSQKMADVKRENNHWSLKTVKK